MKQIKCDCCKVNPTPVKDGPPIYSADVCVNTIDVTSIPEHVQEEISRSTLEFIKSVLRQPGGREMLDAKTAARKARNEGR